MEEERKVSVITEQQSGQVKIADEVVAIIAGLAISDVKGIITLSSRKNKRSYGKGIGIRIDGNDVYCDLAVVLKTGYKVQQVALPVQQKVDVYKRQSWGSASSGGSRRKEYKGRGIEAHQSFMLAD